MNPPLGAGLFLLIAALCGVAADGSRAEYMGGTVDALEEGTGGRVRTTHEEYLVFDARDARITVPYERINLLEYGQNVSRRYIEAIVISPMFLLSKKRQHFLTIGFADDAGKQQALVFRVPKGDIRTMLVTLEARTGRKVQFQDNEARKAGKG